MMKNDSFNIIIIQKIKGFIQDFTQKFSVSCVYQYNSDDDFY